MATIKKKAKGKKKVTSASKHESKKTPRASKQANPDEVRKDIAKIVKSGAKKITKAVMEQAMTGQLAPAKFLFEMAAIYPPSTDGSQTTKDEECFAKTLMDRLDLPDKPIALDEEDDGVKSANPSAGECGGEEAGGQESDPGQPEGSVADGEERRHVSALV